MCKPLPKYLLLIFFLFLLSFCDRKPENGLSQGRILFDITYLQENSNGLSTHMLPQHMKMEYQDDLTRNTIEGGLGFFSLINISDLSNFRNSTYLKLIDKKFAYLGEKREPPCLFEKLEGMHVEFTGENREIIGFQCRHAIASFPDDGIEPFDIWFTKEIPLENPNGNSPFRDIPGVMLEFNTLLGDITMHIQAKKFEAVVFSEEEFQLPQDYKLVSKADMEKIIHALLD